MQIIDTSSISWGRAKKIHGLRAKPIISLLVDRSVVNCFLIDTLEGREPIGENNIFCIGALGDAWQQTSTALLKKYHVTAIDADGWMICEPKPENEVEFAPFTVTEAGAFIQGQWGETVDGIANLQRISPGDFICRQPHDHMDQWVVRRKVFVNTYSVLGETLLH